MDPNFIVAFDHAMLYEIGPWFDSTDMDTIAGNIGTSLLNRKCGYEDVTGDRGGRTKYGIASVDNPTVDVTHLTLGSAMQVYLDQYWILGKCDQIMSAPVTIFQFDMDINNGLGRGAKILQQASHVTIDGNVGPGTLAAVNAMDPRALISALSTIRTNRYNTIVQNDPSQAKFLDGWLRRVSEVTQYSLAQLQ